jgi:hypothetical protein
VTRQALVLAILACTGCDEEERPASTGQTEGVLIRREAHYALRGLPSPERFVLEARGPRFDSLNITLEIRGGYDTVLHRVHWRSGSYLCDEAGCHGDSLSDTAIERQVLAQLDSALAPYMFLNQGQDSSDRLVRFWERPDHLLSLTWQIRQVLPAPADSDLIVHVVEDLRGRPAFLTTAGHTYCVLAWSGVVLRVLPIACGP